MIGVRIERRTGSDRQPALWFEETIDPAVARVWPSQTASESDWFGIRFECGQTSDYHFRIAVGDVLVATTDPEDRDIPPTAGVTVTPFECQGRFLIDWVGLTELTVSQRTGANDWRILLALPIA